MAERRVRWQGVVRFDPERTARYHRRTMPRPKAEYRASRQELEEMQEFHRAFYRGEGPPTPAVDRWLDEARAWALANGYQGVNVRSWETPENMGAVVRWEPRP